VAQSVRRPGQAAHPKAHPGAMPATYHPNITVVGYADELMGVGHLVEDAGGAQAGAGLSRREPQQRIDPSGSRAG
jgi:hypothetical protein